MMYTTPIPRFSPQTIKTIQSYVYALADENDQIFYVGKGVANRVFDHVAQVQTLLLNNENAIVELHDDNREDDAPDDQIGFGHLGDKQRRIASILLNNKLPAMYIIRDSLTPEEALVIESVLISVLDWQLSVPLSNLIAGHGTKNAGLKTAEELEAIRGAAFDLMSLPNAKALRGQSVMAININQRWAEVKDEPGKLYDVSRGHWKVNGARAKRCRFAIVHARGIVRGVFELDVNGWTPAPLDSRRWYFNAVSGTALVDPALCNKNASSLFGVAGIGSQNPIRYLTIPLL